MQTTEYSGLTTEELAQYVEFSDTRRALERELLQRLLIAEAAFEETVYCPCCGERMDAA